MPGYGVVGEDAGTGLLPWAWAVERLQRSHDYWVSTVRPDGRPHLSPVWGLWHDDALWFSCSRRSRKARNLHSNPAVTVATSDPFEPVVVEGRVIALEDLTSVEAFATRSDQKYGTNYGVAFYADASNVCYRVELIVAFGLSCEDFTGSPTRWQFDR